MGLQTAFPFSDIANSLALSKGVPVLEGVPGTSFFAAKCVEGAFGSSRLQVSPSTKLVASRKSWKSF